jgi:hypothetical protein
LAVVVGIVAAALRRLEDFAADMVADRAVQLAAVDMPGQDLR